MLWASKMAGARDHGKNIFAFHLFCLIINIIGCWYDFGYVKLKTYVTYGGRLKFLTHWSKYAHTAFFAFATAVNFYHYVWNRSRAKKSKFVSPGKMESAALLIRLKDGIFVAICFPLGVMVSLLFWGITILEPNGIMSSENLRVIPLFGLYNQYLHTFPLLLDITALCIVSHIYPKRRFGILCVIFIALSYVTWLVHIGNHTGYWCYQFLQHQTRFQFMIFTMMSTLAVTAVYIIGEKLSAFIWKEALTKNTMI